MRFYWIGILFCFWNLAVNGQAPGGVSNNLDVWLDATTGTSTTSPGVGIATWADQSGNGLNATQATVSSRPVYQEGWNNYPFIDYTTGNKSFTIANSTLINISTSRIQESFVLSFQTSSDVLTRQCLYEQGGTARGLNVYIFNNEIYWGGWNLVSDGAGAPWGFSFFKSSIEANTSYVLGFVYSGDDAITGTVDCYLNGVNVGTIANVGRLYSHAGGIGVGAKVGDTYYETGGSSGSGDSFLGEISEFAFYGDALTPVEMNDIGNYLALKWGITIDVSSNDFFAQASNNNGVAGVAIESARNINQTYSAGHDDPEVWLDNPSDLAEGEYLVFGHDGGVLDTTPQGAHASTGYRFDRTWIVEESGDVGTVDVTVDLSAYNYASLSATDFYLLIDPTDTDFSDASAVVASSFDGTTLVFNSIDLANGDFFTFGIPPEPPVVSPGAVSEGLQIWYLPDNGFPTNPGDLISSWEDQTVNGLDVTAAGSTRPVVTTDTFSFNQSAYFDGVNDVLLFPSTPLLNLTSPRDEITHIVAFSTSDNVTSRQIILEHGGGSRGINCYIYNGLLYMAGWNTPNDGAGSPWNFRAVTTPIEANQEYVLTMVFDGNSSTSGTIEGYLDGVSFGSVSGIGQVYAHATGGLGGTSGGTRYENGSKNSSYFKGRIAEYVSYADAKSASEVEDINLYLGFKYGIDIDNSINPYYSFAGYDGDVAGVGQLEAYWGLTKPSTKSVNDGVLLTVSNPSSLDEGDFLFIGHNGEVSGEATATGVHPDFDRRFSRVWRASKTNEVGSYSLEFDLSKFNYSFYSANEFSLLVDALDEDFSDAGKIAPTSFDGSTLMFDNVSLNHGDRFTLGLPIEGSDPGPGGITEGILLWLKADEGTSTTTVGQGVATWSDMSDYGNDAYQTSASLRPIYAADTFNFNHEIEFDRAAQYRLTIDNSAELNLASSRLEYSLCMAFRTSDNISSMQVLYEQGGGSRGVSYYVYQGQFYYGIWNHPADSPGGNWGGLYHGVAVKPNTEYIVTMVFDGKDDRSGTVSCYMNGTLVGTLNGAGRLYGHSGTIGLGYQNDNAYYHFGSRTGDNYYFDGQIAEFLIFGNVLTPTDITGLHTYLSIKYGVSIPAVAHDYFDDAYIGYQNLVAGIGNEPSYYIDQTESKNEADSSRVRIFNPSSLDVGDVLSWGTDLETFCNLSNAPGLLDHRIARVWRVDETGDVGTVDVEVDLTGILDGPALSVSLLVDDDGDFSNATEYSLGSSVGDVLTFTAVDFSKGDYFTVGTVGLFNNPNPLELYEWSGTESSIWNNSANWNGCGVPEDGSSIRVVSTVNQPELDQIRVVNDLEISNSGNLNLNGFDLDITGNFQNDGTLTSGGSKIIFNGSAKQFISGSGISDLEDVEIDNANGLEISGGEVSVRGSLDITTGSLTTNGNLVLRSEQNKTGRIGVVSVGQIMGDVTMERYLEQSQRQWRYVGTPFVDTQVDDWQNDFPITGGFTGLSVGPGLTNNASMYFYDETNAGSTILEDYMKYPTTDSSALLTNGRGYAVYVREETDFVMTNTGEIFVGPKNFGVSYTTTGAAGNWGWNLIANPYPSQIDWGAAGWSRSNVDNAIYFTDNENGMQISYVNGISVPFGECQGVLASHQAFWVHANNSSPSLSCDESVKIDDDNHRFYRMAEQSDQLIMTLKRKNSSIEDQAVFYLEDDATAGFDANADALKLFDNNGLRVSTFTDNQAEELVINAFPRQGFDSVTVDINVEMPQNGTHILSFEFSGPTSELNDFYLLDTRSGQFINITEQPSYQFSVADAADEGADRFKLVLMKPDIITTTDYEYEFAVEIFPNPVNDGYLNVSLQEGAVDGQKVRVISQLGVEVADFGALEFGLNQFDIPDHLPSGVYFLEIADGQNKKIESIIVNAIR